LSELNRPASKKQIPVSYQFECLVFSEDGNRLVSGDNTGVVRLWHAPSVQEISNEAGPQTGKAEDVLRHSVALRTALPL